MLRAVFFLLVDFLFLPFGLKMKSFLLCSMTLILLLANAIDSQPLEAKKQSRDGEIVGTGEKTNLVNAMDAANPANTTDTADTANLLDATDTANSLDTTDTVLMDGSKMVPKNRKKRQSSGTTQETFSTLGMILDLVGKGEATEENCSVCLNN